MTPMGTRYRTVYNVTDRPVPIDDDGRIAAGGEWTPVLASHPLVRSAVDLGVLVFVTPPDTTGDDVRKALNPAALAAFDEVERLNTADGPEELAELADELDATPTPAARKAAARAQEAKAR
jgi:hypothetical protein